MDYRLWEDAGYHHRFRLYDAEAGPAYPNSMEGASKNALSPALIVEPYGVFAKCRPFLPRVLACTAHAENAKEGLTIFENALALTVFENARKSGVFKNRCRPALLDCGQNRCF